MSNARTEVGRNDPCPCGSGVRFKACHGALEAVPPASQDAQTSLAQARAAMAAARYEDAEARAQAAVAQDHRSWEAWLLLGDLQRRRSDPDRAIAMYDRALSLEPNHPVVLNNLGLALLAAGRTDAALLRFEEAIARAPRFMQAHANLGELWMTRGDDPRAARAFAAAVACSPNIAQLWVRKGLCEYRVGALDDAATSLFRARELAPDDPDVAMHLASVHTARKRYAEALPLATGALERAPRNGDAENLLLYISQHLCLWDRVDGLFERQRARLHRGDPALVPPHNMLTLPYTPAELLQGAQRWSAERVRSVVTRTTTRVTRLTQKLRIAYLGPDFRAHPLANLLTEVIELHDRARFEVIGYSVGPDDGSVERARFARAFDRFHDLPHEPSSAIAQRIRDDEITILVDTSGYVQHARPEVFAERAAPLQINGIGFAGTLGAPWYDYILSDRCVLPQSVEAHFTERPLHLPHCYMPGDRRRHMAAAPTRVGCGLPAQGFVYCCFNSSYKIASPVFGTWLRILSRVPGSVLWLLHPPAGGGKNLRAAAERAGIDPARLVFAPHVAAPHHLARHAVADLFLDTLPYNAHTTANDALFAGLPLLSCPGETFASRVAASHLLAAGLPELVVPTLREYEDLAVELAADPLRLRDLRSRLMRGRDSSPLFDTPAYTRALEASFAGAAA